MTLHPVILLSRAGMVGDPLVKASLSHKYWKREPYFVGGKLRYRYYYNTPEDREKYRRQHDPHDDHDHHIRGDETMHHENLPPQLLATSALNGEKLESLLSDMAPRGTQLKVQISAAFERRHKQGFVEAEEQGRTPERNPIQRITKALDMVNDEVRKLVSVRNIKITTRDDRGVKKKFEQGDPPRPVPAAYSDRNGTMVFCADGEGHGGGSGFNVHPSGYPRFGSPLTQSEETVWREVGRQLRYGLASKRKEAWDEWKAIAGDRGSGDRLLSSFARQNDEHDFQESFACMMSHPKQMAGQCPERYAFFVKHGLVTAPDAEEIKTKAPGNLAWWDNAKESPARQLYHDQKQDKGQPMGVPYISTKDEFFQVSMGGRTVYFRTGPSGPQDEAHWESMPDVLDPETGFPVYDKKVAAAFRAKGKIKEIYDEHGTRMDEEVAFLYLNQEDNQIKGFNPKTHRLGYMMYIGLGESVGNPEKERAAVKKMIKQGQDPAKKRDRWVKAPHKMSADEFHAKTPSFAFGKLQQATAQPFKALDGGKPILHVNPMTGKEEVKLAARVYESVNPDGSITQLRVKESQTFQYGDELHLPVTDYIKDEETGEVFERTTEKLITLDPREHPNITAVGLSKQFKVPVVDMLTRNNALRQYQLIDPIMATLINPAGVQIKDRATMVSLLMSAAEVQPEKWCTVQIGSDPASHTHVRLKFDGAGAPLLVGEYWERKLGKPNPRLSDLVKGSRLNVEKAKVRKPRMRKTKVGHPVRVNVEGHWVFADLVEKDTSGGKRRYSVMVHPGQGVEPPYDREVRQVKRVPTDVDPERPGIRMREFKPLQSDVLLYTDEVRVNSKGDYIHGSGKLKVMLPADGSWNFESMIRIPGVHTNEEGDLLVDPSEIEQFREAVGGFVVDDLSQAKLSKISQASKARSDAGRAGKTPMTSIVDPTNGNTINTQKLLKGCKSRIGSRDFKLGSHQAELLKAMADNDGRIIAAHYMGTGKTVSAICAVKMMQNLETEDGKPHPNRPKRVCIVVPKNTAQQWVDAVDLFTEGTATLIGAGGVGGLAGALQMPSMPNGFELWSDAKKEAYRQTKLKDNHWRPEDDDTDIVIVSQEYFTTHADELKRTGNFDGIIVDEAHGIQRDNERNKKVEAWNPDMKMMMLLTGTPVTNKLNTLTNYARLISNGEVDFGSEEQFENEHLVESAVMKANGAEKAAKMDLNPQRMGILQKKMKPYMHVATTADVKGKTMPAVSLDENNPAAMTNIQATLYRGYMGRLRPEDRRLLEVAATLGEDEADLLSPDAKRKVRVARNITNSPGYKPPDGREFVTIEEEDPDRPDKMKKVVFRMPDWNTLSRTFKGKWPSLTDVPKKMTEQEFIAFTVYATAAVGKDYTLLSGRKISETVSADNFDSIKRGAVMGDQSIKFGGRVPNPEYGPEGAIARGRVGAGGEIKPIEYHVRNADGSIKETITVPTGLRFMRDPGQKSAGLYYIAGVPKGHAARGTFGEGDWDFEKDVYDKDLGYGKDDDGDKIEGSVRSADRGQRPREGMNQYSVQRHPERRRERLMFDLVMTDGNAKADALESYIGEKTDPSLGGNPDGQMILFGKAIGSSCRTMESKLRLMGYKDVNEVLNDTLAGDDPVPSNGKYFVTYMGDNATLGDRDVNSEIFRKRKGPDGRDLKMSMFVHRALHGSDQDPPKVGEVLEGWSRGSRDTIAKNFAGVEMPLRVTAVDVNGTTEYRYAYESEMNAKDTKAFKALEEKRAHAKGADKDRLQGEMNKILGKYWSDRKPLTERQMGVFNNCQVMMASDAAQVGLNWGNATDLVMYDSLFSPMNEAQRITRAARMLDPAVADKLKPAFDKLAAIVEDRGKEDEFAAYDGNAAGAMAIVGDILKDHPDIHQELLASGANPTAIAETFLAQRSLDRINALRGPIEQELRANGRIVVEGSVDENGKKPYVKPEEITSGDVMNEIVQSHLKPFEKQILRSRKYLVDVKRLTTSVETPVMETVTRTEMVNGKKVRVKEERPTGAMKIEHPSKAEKAVLMAGRAKQVPTEKFLNLMQEELPPDASFDFTPAGTAELMMFSKETTTEVAQEKRVAQRDELKERRAAEREERKAAKAKFQAERKAASVEIKAQRARESRERALAKKKPPPPTPSPKPKDEISEDPSIGKSWPRFVVLTGRK